MIVISKTFRFIQFKNPRKLHEVEFFNAKAFHIFWPLKFNRIQIRCISYDTTFRFQIHGLSSFVMVFRRLIPQIDLPIE